MVSVKLYHWKKEGLNEIDVGTKIIRQAINEYYPYIKVDETALILEIKSMLKNKEYIASDMMGYIYRYYKNPVDPQIYHAAIRLNCRLCADVIVSKICPEQIIKWDSKVTDAYSIFKNIELNKNQMSYRYKHRLAVIIAGLSDELKDYEIPDLTIGELFTIVRYYTGYKVSDILKLSPYELYSTLMDKMNLVFSYKSQYHSESCVFFANALKWIASILEHELEDGNLSQPLHYIINRKNTLKHPKGINKIKKASKTEFLEYANYK